MIQVGDLKKLAAPAQNPQALFAAMAEALPGGLRLDKHGNLCHHEGVAQLSAGSKAAQLAAAEAENKRLHRHVEMLSAMIADRDSLLVKLKS